MAQLPVGHTILFDPDKEADTMGKWRGSQHAALLTLPGGLLAAVAAEAQDELFVLNADNNAVTVYSRTASSNGGGQNAEQMLNV